MLGLMVSAGGFKTALEGMCTFMVGLFCAYNMRAKLMYFIFKKKRNKENPCIYEI